MAYAGKAELLVPRGVAQFGLARLTGGQEVAGSNPVAPISVTPSRTASPRLARRNAAVALSYEAAYQESI